MTENRRMIIKALRAPVGGRIISRDDADVYADRLMEILDLPEIGEGAVVIMPGVSIPPGCAIGMGARCGQDTVPPL